MASSYHGTIRTMLCWRATSRIRVMVGSSSPFRLLSCRRQDDLRAEGPDHSLWVAVPRGVDVELVDASILQLLQLCQALIAGPEHAEPVHHLVRDEPGVLGADPAVVLV